MTPSPTLKKFLTDGTKPTSQREISALLDETFSLLKEIADGKSRITNQADFLTADQLAAKARPAPVAAKPTAAAPVATAKPAPVKPATQTATTTAAQFATPKLTITREDFRKLNPQDKSRFLKSNGTLV
jgi:hypothetical protein